TVAPRAPRAPPVRAWKRVAGEHPSSAESAISGQLAPPPCRPPAPRHCARTVASAMTDQGDRPMRTLAIAFVALAVTACQSPRPVEHEASTPPSSTAPREIKPEGRRQAAQAIAPKSFPRVPPPDAAAAEVPAGYKVEVVVRDLTYPTAVTFDGEGNLFIAEAGFAYGDPTGDARVLRVARDGKITIVADQLHGPVNDVLWHAGRLYIAHLATVSVVEPGGAVRDIVTDLPVTWEHHHNQLA